MLIKPNCECLPAHTILLPSIYIIYRKHLMIQFIAQKKDGTAFSWNYIGNI